MSSEIQSLEQDDVFDILSNSRRRYMLYLLSKKGSMKLVDLAEHVAAWENDTDVENITKKERKRVYVSLYQTHVPKLEDAGVLEYDSDSGIVTPRSATSDIEPYLKQADLSSIWQYLYAPLVIFSLLVVGLASTNLLFFVSLSTFDIALLLLGALVMTVTVHALIWSYYRFETPDEFR